jgi:EAL domain-containing protein (putative c-di-GMP-specific phosphodiesterase class I)
MAHKLGLKVVAEGVETEPQLNLLKAAGCDYAQGYVYAHPMPASQMGAMARGPAQLA